nr:3-hydroxyacyl-CoA dehydrogenase family protein [Microbulbifer salipaludis]
MVLHKEYPGYLLNSLLGPLLTTAVLLVTRSRASIEQVDRAWMRNMGAPMGPFGMMDFFGLNVVLDSWNRPAQTLERAQFKAEITAYLQSFVESGYIGMKSGRGFYTYPAPSYVSEHFIRQERSKEEIFTALMANVVQAGLLIVADGAATATEVDLAWRVGTGLETAPLELVNTSGSFALRDTVLSAHSDLSLLNDAQRQQAHAALAAAVPA